MTTIQSTDYFVGLPPLYSTEGTSLENKLIGVKLFGMMSGYLAFLIEYDPTEDIAFGFVSLGGQIDDPFAEFGYVSGAELRDLTQFGAPAIERDLYFTPGVWSEVKARPGGRG